MQEEKNKRGFENWPEWKKLSVIIAASILLLLVAILAIGAPVYLCVVKESIVPLLLWCIPAGVVMGLRFYDEEFR